MFDGGLFGGLFDLNGDGQMDFFEQAMEFGAIMRLLRDEEEQDSLDDDFDDFDDDLI